MGNTRWADVAETARRTTSAASVAYATDESGSEAKIGSASHFGSSVSSSWSDAIARPTTTRFTPLAVCVIERCPHLHDREAQAGRVVPPVDRAGAVDEEPLD